ncbi:MAG: DUF503 domain-containing protein [Synergistes sp.]|nr:DUF503 domain-containing protein [Synergistes sp.]
MDNDLPLWIAAARFSVIIPYAASLKDRRRVVRSLLDGTRQRFSVSAADLGPADTHNAAELGFAACGSSYSELLERMASLKKFLCQREDEGDFEITKSLSEVFNNGDL